MTRKRNLTIWVLSLFFLAAGVVGCDFPPTEITLYVYGQGANFSGEYTVDDSSEPVLFYGEETTSGVFKYSETIEIEDRILVNVFPEHNGDEDDADETDMTDLTFRIYEDDALVTETSYSISSTLMKTFDYDLDDVDYDTDL